MAASFLLVDEDGRQREYEVSAATAPLELEPRLATLAASPLPDKR